MPAPSKPAPFMHAPSACTFCACTCVFADFLAGWLLICLLSHLMMPSPTSNTSVFMAAGQVLLVWCISAEEGNYRSLLFHYAGHPCGQ